MNQPDATAEQIVGAAAHPVERSSPLPAWAQVDADLRRIIERDLEVGDKLPNERELAQLYDVSRITIRQALGGLESDGFLERRQGAGTFVARRPEMIQHDFGLTTPWKQRFIASGHEAVSVHLRAAPPEQQPYELTRLLTAEEARAEVWHAKRVHTVDGRPIGITDSWVGTAMTPGLADEPLIDGSMSQTLSERFGLEDVGWSNYLEVGLAGPADAGLLNTNIGAQLILIWSVSRLSGRTLLETSRTAWLASRVRFHYRTGPAAAAVA